jgi:phage-related protein
VPVTDLIFYQERDEVPILKWLESVPPKAADKCLAYLGQLELLGHELRRPLADFLGDGIYELRPSYQGVHYRLLYFFSGKNVVVVSHGLKKEGEIPAGEMRRAIERKRKFEADPKAHTFRR